MECAGHLGVELVEDFILFPEVVHVALDLFEIGAGDSTGVGKEVRDHENAAFVDDLVCFWSGWAIGAFADDFDFLGNPIYVFASDLVFKCCWDEYVNFLFDPCITCKYLIPEVLGFLLVDSAEPVGDFPEFIKAYTS